MKSILLTAAATTILAACGDTGLMAGGDASCSGTAAYQVTFEAAWTASSANAAIPGNAHFSPAFAATHADSAALYTTGRTASAGIKQMAETGATGLLEGETRALSQAGLLGDTDKGSRLDATGRTTLNLTADSGNDQLTLVSMIAPSPDWFVGTSSFDLCQGGSWVENTSFDLGTYDAGTDSGTTFAAADQATNPEEPIRFLNKDLDEQTRRSNAVFGKIFIEKI